MPCFVVIISVPKNFTCSRVHHIARASWYGGLIDLYQTSAESPLIFLLLQNLFRSVSLNDLKSFATQQCNFTSGDWTSFITYSAAFYDSFGNYFQYGLKKFIPGVSTGKFECLVNNVAGNSSLDAKTASSIKSLWSKTKGLIYYLGPRHQSLAFGPVGITTYFSTNCNASDAKLVKDFLVSKKVEAWNSRVIKTFDTNSGQANYEIRFASALPTDKNELVDGLRLGVAVQYKGNKFTFSRGKFSGRSLTTFFKAFTFHFAGDYRQLLARVNAELTKARTCLANRLELVRLISVVKIRFESTIVFPYVLAND